MSRTVEPDHYTRDGIQYRRVTRLLDWLPNSALLDWKLRVGKTEANRIVRQAEKVGTEVDRLISASLVRESVSLTSKQLPIQNCLKAYQEWQLWNVPHADRILSIQTTYYDEDAKIAGTPDLVYDHEIIDWKCTSAIRQQHVFQVICYWHLVSLAGYPIRQARIVRLDPQLATFEELVVKQYDPTVYAMINLLGQVEPMWKQLTGKGGENPHGDCATDGEDRSNN